MSGVSMGFWTPSAEFNDVSAMSRRAVDIIGVPQSRDFPLDVIPIAGGAGGVYIAQTVGHIPLHTDRKSSDQNSLIFNFVLETDARPMLMTAPSTPSIDVKILQPQTDATFALGCFEIRPGQVFHMDVANTWHGIGSMPYPGRWALPKTLIIQCEWPNPREVQNAIEKVKRSFRADPRFAAFVL